MMYCSATRSCIASKPPGILMTSATLADAFGRRGGDGEGGRGLPFGFVDLLLALAPRSS